MTLDRASLIPALRNIATRLRIDSLRSTSEAGSGHPTSCCSAADLVAALFFAEMRFDPKDPHNPDSDRFILSKGHAAPILYAAWAEAGALERAELLKLREIDSNLEGHPTPRLPFVDVATGSLGQGICAAVGSALTGWTLRLRDLCGPVAVEARVEPAAAHQFVVRALLDDHTVLEHDDQVGVTDRRESVRDHEGRPAREQRP